MSHHFERRARSALSTAFRNAKCISESGRESLRKSCAGCSESSVEMDALDPELIKKVRGYWHDPTFQGSFSGKDL